MPTDRPAEGSHVRAGQRRRGRRPHLGQRAGGRGQTAGAKSVDCSEGVSWVNASDQELNSHLPPSASGAAGFPSCDSWDFFFFNLLKSWISLRWATLHRPHPLFEDAGRWRVCAERWRGMDRCVQIILNSYGIVVTLVPSLYYSLFLKKQHIIFNASLSPVFCTVAWTRLVCVTVRYTEHGVDLRDVQWNVRWPCLCCTGVSSHMSAASQSWASAGVWQSEHVQWRLCECRTHLSVASSVFIVLHQSEQLNLTAKTHQPNWYMSGFFYLFPDINNAIRLTTNKKMQYRKLYLRSFRPCPHVYRYFSPSYKD